MFDWPMMVYNVHRKPSYRKISMHPESTVLIHREPNQEAMARLVEAGIPPLLASLYSARGISEASEVRGSVNDLLPVDDLKNARAMGKILADCRQSQERILIISDYDCDGATAGSVLIQAFKGAGLNFDILVPDRLKHGYGLTPSIVDEAAALPIKPRFIITVDNGISSTYGVERAREHGIEVLVTDHHLCPEVLPNARLIVNPQQPGDEFASKAIAGCGVAWYVARAMHDEIKDRGQDPGFDPMELTPFVAMGTVADVVPLDRNNRLIVSEGLRRIRAGECTPGIKALANVAKRNHEQLTCTDIGFALGPRINAAGRMAHMSSGIECLTTSDHDAAVHLACELDEINATRRELQKSMIDEANARAQSLSTVDSDARSLVVYEKDWHEGVVGIVAGRLKDDMHRPTFVLCDAQDGGIKGSGRSIDGFHLKHALDQINIEHPGVLLKFGGHAAAAGVTIAPDRLRDFKQAFERVCQEHLTPEMLERRACHDGALPSRHLNPDDIREMDLQVWGQGFPPPVFLDDFKVLNSRTMGADGDHLKVVVDAGGRKLDVVAFGEGHRIADLPRALKVMFRPSINEWNGNVTVQLMAEGFFAAPDLNAQLQRGSEVKNEAKSPAPAQKPAPAKKIAPDQAANLFGAMIAAQRQNTPAPVAPAVDDEDADPRPARRLGFRMR